MSIEVLNYQCPGCHRRKEYVKVPMILCSCGTEMLIDHGLLSKLPGKKIGGFKRLKEKSFGYSLEEIPSSQHHLFTPDQVLKEDSEGVRINPDL